MVINCKVIKNSPAVKVFRVVFITGLFAFIGLTEYKEMSDHLQARKQSLVSGRMTRKGNNYPINLDGTPPFEVSSLVDRGLKIFKAEGERMALSNDSLGSRFGSCSRKEISANNHYSALQLLVE
jgi:hypothetical protein